MDKLLETRLPKRKLFFVQAGEAKLYFPDKEDAIKAYSALAPLSSQVKKSVTAFSYDYSFLKESVYFDYLDDTVLLLGSEKIEIAKDEEEAERIKNNFLEIKKRASEKRRVGEKDG